MAHVRVGGAEAVPRLPYEAVFRIEVSLSSQSTSAIVMRTTAQLYCLEGTHSSKPTTGDAEWHSLAYGAPCIQLVRHSNGNSFTVRIVIVEVESGISLWETSMDGNSRYAAMQSNFHTFVADGSVYAIQFVSEEEAGRMLESMQDLLSQDRQLAATMQQHASAESAVQPVVFKKPAKPLRRLSKKDISAPCNFKHVSGITLQRTSSCEQELQGTIQRKMRSLSLTNLYRHKSGEEGAQSSRLGERGQEEKPTERKSSKKRRSFRRKSWKDSTDNVTITSMRQTDPRQMSLPSRFCRKEQPAISQVSPVPPSHTHHSLNRAHSQSSGDIPTAHSHPATPYHHSATHKPHSPSLDCGIERRHTMLERSPSPRHHPVNYQPTANIAQPFVSDMTLNRIPVHEGGGVTSSHQQRGEQTVQHVAIAESDIMGWTPDGRLLVQMPALGVVGREGGGGAEWGNAAPTRRASTGHFPSFGSLPQKYGSTDTLQSTPHNLPSPSSHNLPSPSSHNPPPNSATAPRNRPLPPTPLDIAMPQSKVLRSKGHIASSIEHTAAKLPATMATNQPANELPVALGNVPPVAVQSRHQVTMANKGVPFPIPTPSHRASSDHSPLGGGVASSEYPPCHHHSGSADATLLDVTDQMSRALAQFDELLGVAQTSL